MSFGIAPAFILYHFSLKQLGGLGWAVALVFVVCMSLRLARFNVQDEMPKAPSALRSHYFTGVPAPAAAVLGLMPLMVWFDFKLPLAKDPWLIAGVALVVSLLMVSRIPTFAFKGMKVAPSQVAPVLILAAVMIAGLLSAPWCTLLILGVLYVLSFPLSWRRYRRECKVADEALS
jgi:CDP-diacylglycerol--serine O-phosphatidyltransferase